MARLCRGVKVSGYYKGYSCGSFANGDSDYCAAHGGMSDRENRLLQEC